MNIFDAHISGSLSVSASAEISGDLIILGGVNSAGDIIGSADFDTLRNVPSGLISGSSQLTTSYDGRYVLSGSITQTTWDNIASKPTGIVSGSSQVLNGSGVWSGSAQLPSGVISGSSQLPLGTVSGSSQIDVTQTTGFDTFSSSIATTDTNQNTKISSLETSSGSIRDNFNSYTGSNEETNTTQNNRLTSIETSTGSLNSFTGSINTTIKTKLNDEGIISGSSQVTFGNVTGIPTGLISGSSQVLLSSGIWSGSSQLPSGVVSGSSQVLSGTGIFSSSAQLPSDTISGSAQVDITSTTGYSVFSSSIVTTVNSLSSSIASTDLNQSSKISSLETESGSVRTDFNTYTGSNDTTNTTQNNKLTSIETSTGSLNTFTSSIDTTIKSKLNTDGVISGSSQVLSGTGIYSSSAQLPSGIVSGSGQISYGSISGTPSGIVSGSGQIDITQTTGYSTFSSSLATTDENQSSKISSLETESGSVRSVLNVFTSSVNSSLSSMSEAIEFTGSNLTVKGNLLVKGTNTTVNSTTLDIGDNVIQLNGTGATNAGLVVRDATSPNTLSGSLLWDTTNDKWIAGPLGSEQTIVIEGTLNTFTSSVNTKISSLETESGSVRTDFNSYTSSNNTNVGTLQMAVSTLNTYTSSNNNRLFLIEGTTGSLNTFTSSINTTIKSKMDADGVISGSSQVLSGTGIYSSSAQLPSGIVSGSSQVLSGTGIYSSSVQLPSGLVSGSSQVSFNGITDKPTLVSGSSQITFGSVTGVPSGLVSGSSQVLNSSGVWSGSAQLPSGVISGSSQLPAGLVSGSSQVLSGTGIVSGSSQITFGSISSIPAGLVSGSGQIAFGSITGVPTGLVSGSGQITLTSTQVTNGLGFTPYNATNPSNYISSITSGNVTTALGYTPYNATNPNGYITGISFANVSSKPTTVSGYGITDAWVAEGSWKPTSLSSSTRLIGKTSPDGGEFGLAYTGGQIHAYVDGFFYQNEGAYRVIDTNSISSQSVNYANTAGNITAYTINQSVGTGNSPTFAGATLTNNMTFSTQGSKVIFGDSTSGSPSMIGEGLVDTLGSDSDFLTIYARNSLRIYSAGTNEVFRFTAASNYSYNHIVPGTNNTYNLGSATYGWANVYTNDLHLSNMNKPEGNDIDGTSGTWTIQEGDENLYIINNRNGKKFKISLEEII